MKDEEYLKLAENLEENKEKLQKIVDYQNNWKDRAYNTAVIAAPIEIAGDSYYMATVIRVGKTENSYYLHEIALIEIDGQKKEDNAAFKTGTIDKDRTPSAESSSVYNILLELLNVNNRNENISLKDEEYLKLAENSEENKKRIEKWEKRTRLQLPVGDSYFDSINSISKNTENVNTRNENFSMKDEEYLKLAENSEENKKGTVERAGGAKNNSSGLMTMERINGNIEKHTFNKQTNQFGKRR